MERLLPIGTRVRLSAPPAATMSLAPLAICAAGAHNGALTDRSTLKDLRETVRDIVENR
jgi:hypothetical protein